MPFVGGPNTLTTDSRWRTAAILKNRKIDIFRPRFDRFRPNLACRCSSAVLSCLTVKNVKNPRWRYPSSWKNRHISTAFWHTSTKFGMSSSSALFSHLTVKNLKFEKSKMAATAIVKNRYMSAVFGPTSTKFGMPMQFCRAPDDHHLSHSSSCIGSRFDNGLTTSWPSWRTRSTTPPPGLPQPSHPASHRHSSASLFCYATSLQIDYQDQLCRPCFSLLHTCCLTLFTIPFRKSAPVVALFLLVYAYDVSCSFSKRFVVQNDNIAYLNLAIKQQIYM